MTDELGLAVTRFDFASGALRGSHFTLYPGCLVHRNGRNCETVPLAAIASLRVAFTRDARKLGWGIGLALIGLLAYFVAGPLGAFAEGALKDLAAAGSEGVAAALHGLFRFVAALASLLPVAAVACVAAGAALAVLGWLGRTVLVLDLSGSQRVYPVRGRNAALFEFTEAVSERLVSLKR